MQQNLSLKVCSKPSAPSTPSTGSGTALRIGFAFTLFLAFLLLSSCMPKKKTSSRLKVVASVPVLYDWTRNLMDERENTRLFLNLIVKNGLQYHSFSPGITEENLINSADLLIYVGGPSEQWIDDIIKNNPSAKDGRLVLKLIDCITDDSSETPDEHFIFSPVKAKVCCQEISDYLCKLDPQNEASYKESCSKYKGLLSILDNSFQIQAQKTQNQDFIICDRMPFGPLFKEYGFNYVALYDKCPAPEKFQPETETIKEFGRKIDQTNAGAVYVFDNSDKKLAKQVIAASKNPKCDTLVFDSMEGLTLSQLFSGKNYINIMQNNLTLLRPN